MNGCTDGLCPFLTKPVEIVGKTVALGQLTTCSPQLPLLSPPCTPAPLHPTLSWVASARSSCYPPVTPPVCTPFSPSCHRAAGRTRMPHCSGGGDRIPMELVGRRANLSLSIVRQLRGSTTLAFTASHVTPFPLPCNVGHGGISIPLL